MTEKEKAAKGLLYDANYDKELINHRIACKRLCHQLNISDPTDIDYQREIFPQIVGSVGKDFFVTTPFNCDYGYNTFIGDNFYCNHNLIILDCAKVSIGNHVFIAPNCCISTAGHPLDYVQRNQGLEFAFPITIEDNV
ncbi:MAG: maltose acetyltransferase, partial [Candidatus Epulonipiscium fishelsonii]